MTREEGSDDECLAGTHRGVFHVPDVSGNQGEEESKRKAAGT